MKFMAKFEKDDLNENELVLELLDESKTILIAIEDEEKAMTYQVKIQDLKMALKKLTAR